MDPDDLETRAALHALVGALTAAHRALDALSLDAAARIGLTDADLDRIAVLVSRSLWTSTADLNQAGGEAEVARVIARAAELEARA